MIGWRALGTGAAAVALVASAGVSLGRWLDPTHGAAGRALARRAPFGVPAFSALDQDGREVTNARLAGHVWVASFLVPECGRASDTVAAAIGALARAAFPPGRGADLRFVSFSADPYETARARAAVNARWAHDARWRLLAPERFSTFAVAMGLAPSEGQLWDHLLGTAAYLFLVDQAGVVRGSYDARDDGELERLRGDLSRAAAQAPPPMAAKASLAGGTSGAIPRPRRAPAFSYVGQDGRVLSRADLAGHPWIADFIYTSCSGACPMLTARLAALRRRLPSPALRFVSFSVDPDHDTPAALAAYAARFGGGDDPRWSLLRTTRETVSALAAGLGAVAFRTTDDAAPSAIVHSDRFVLVGADGTIRGAWDSGDPESVRELVAAVEAQPEVAAAPARARIAGDALYARLGCGGCHGGARAAPALEGVAGGPVHLEGGATVPADDAYLRESILDPAAKVVAGYGPTMPTYRGLVDDADLAALVAHVRALTAPARHPLDRVLLR